MTIDADLLHQAMKAGRGVILLGPHIGNWEFTSHYLANRYPFAAMYRPTRIREIDEALRKSRERIGAELVPATGTGLRRICRILKGGGLVGILPDQEPHKGHGVFAPFFGVPALTMTLVGDLHREFGSPVLFGWMERTAKGTFRGTPPSRTRGARCRRQGGGGDSAQPRGRDRRPSLPESVLVELQAIQDPPGGGDGRAAEKIRTRALAESALYKTRVSEGSGVAGLKVRTQLVLAFLLLAVLPLMGIVLYSYSTSRRAFRQAVEAESWMLAQEMSDRLDCGPR